jgi:hypothetical protein
MMNRIDKTALEHNLIFANAKKEFKSKEIQKIQDITTRAEACARDILNLPEEYPNQSLVVRHYHHHDSWYWQPYGWGWGDTHNHYYGDSKSHICHPVSEKKNEDDEDDNNNKVGVAVLVAALAALGYSFYSAAKIHAQKIATSAAQKKVQKDLKQIEELKEKSEPLKDLRKVVRKESKIIDRISGKLTREAVGTALLGAAGLVGLGSYVGQNWQLAYAAGALGSAAIGTWMVSWYKNQSEEAHNRKDAETILKKIATFNN